MPRGVGLGPVVGRITGTTQPDRFVFTFDPSKPVKLYDYVVVEMEDIPPGSDSSVSVKVVAQVYSIERASLGLTPEHPWSVVREYNIPLDLDTPRAVAKVLGYKWKGEVVRPRSAPPVGSWVYLAPDNLLEEFYSVEPPRRLHIGYLISRPNVPAYLDVEGLKRHLAIIAATGAGKTWTSVVLIEELLKKYATIVVLDPHGEYVTMKSSACSKVPEYCNRIRVVKVHREQEGDLIYQIDVTRLDGLELANLAGIPSNATRIRSVVIHAKDVADVLAKELGVKKLGSLQWLRKVIITASNAVSSAKIGSSDKRFEIFERVFRDRLRQSIVKELGLDEKKVSDALENAAASLEYINAVQQLYATLAKSVEPALAAIRYILELEDLGVYSTTTLPLDELLIPGSVTVVNLAGLPEQVQDHVASSILKRVFEARVRHMRRLPGERFPYPVLVVVEEAHRFIPAQRQTRSSPIATMIATEGRKFGVFLSIITQRPSRINPDVLSQAQSQIILRIVNPRDQQAVRDASEQLSQELFENLPGLNSGEAIIVGPVTKVPMMVRIRERILEYSGQDISLVAAWSESAASSAGIEELLKKLSEKLSSVTGSEISPDYNDVRSALAYLLNVRRLDLRTLRRALHLVARGKVDVYSFDIAGSKIYGKADGYEVEVALGGGLRRCDCGADSTVDEDAVCHHMVAVLIKALLDGILDEYVEREPILFDSE